MIKLERHEFDERDLLGRAMRNMRAPTRIPQVRWALVMKTFGVGSTVAQALCREFGLDPDDEVRK